MYFQPLIYVILFTGILFLLELSYFRIAEKFGIRDLPNERSSHTKITIRGGGIIFSLGITLYAAFTGFTDPYFIAGLLSISFISFLDDIKPRDYKLRMAVHLIAVMLLFYELQLFNSPLYIILIALIFVIGTVNAINFMDGINGLTGSYGLLTLLTLFFINQYVQPFIDPYYLIAACLSTLVFLFFNFRTKAVCFAGDVGSVSLAFILLFFILKLILISGSISYILLLLVYGLDTVTTIVFRILRKENISEAHRSHFYQFLANEKKLSHLLVTAIYICIQMIVNIVLIYYRINKITDVIIILITSGIVFVIIRVLFEGSNRLFMGLRNKQF